LGPLCEQLAKKIHGGLTPIEIAYMRRATLAWSLFYVALMAAIFVLYFTAPLSLWSLFVNFGTFSLIVLAGLADHALRKSVHFDNAWQADTMAARCSQFNYAMSSQKCRQRSLACFDRAIVRDHGVNFVTGG